MKKVDLSDVCFLVHVRIDTVARQQNLEIIQEFYRKYADNTQFIFIEDDAQQKITESVTLTENDKYIFHENPGIYLRPKCYNIASKETDRPVIVSLDTDIIIHPKYMKMTADRLIKEDNLAICYPYNGLFLNLYEHTKEEFMKTLDYEDLTKHKPESKQVNYSNGKVFVGHYDSVGGCVFFNHDRYNKFGGYNPMFKGWGYEDNEITIRTRALGYDISRVMDEDAILFHLPHDGPGQSPKATHEFYQSNAQLSVMTETMTKEQMEEFIKQWEV